MPEGRVIKAYAGHYYVNYEGTIVDCAVRGRLRREGKDVLVGDLVSFSFTDAAGTYGVIEDVLPRRSRLARPPVANVDQAVVVAACKEPEPDLELLDRMLLVVGGEGLKATVCINKIDLVTAYAAEKLAAPYRQAGYKVIKTSARAGWGLKGLRRALAGRVSVFAGPSGVGKSALLNALEPGLRLDCGEVSPKTGRGRHTTRHSVLLVVKPSGYVADAPGFSKIDLEGIAREELGGLFPELRLRMGECRFAGCLHFKEPDCAVRAAVASREIARSRYDHYIKFLAEIIEAERGGRRL